MSFDVRDDEAMLAYVITEAASLVEAMYAVNEGPDKMPVSAVYQAQVLRDLLVMEWVRHHGFTIPPNDDDELDLVAGQVRDWVRDNVDRVENMLREAFEKGLLI